MFNLDERKLKTKYNLLKQDSFNFFASEFSMFFSLSLYLSHLFLSFSNFDLVSLSIYLSHYLYLSFSIFLSLSLSLALSQPLTPCNYYCISLSVYLSISLFIPLAVYLSLSISFCLSLYLVICHPYLSIFISSQALLFSLHPSNARFLSLS